MVGFTPFLLHSYRASCNPLVVHEMASNTICSNEKRLNFSIAQHRVYHSIARLFLLRSCAKFKAVCQWLSFAVNMG